MTVQTAPQAAETPPVPLGYASAGPLFRPERRLSSAMVALVVGIVLLGVALYGLLYVLRSVMAPEIPAPGRSDFIITMTIMVCMFCAVCTIIALVFLVVGLKWLAGVSRLRS